MRQMKMKKLGIVFAGISLALTISACTKDASVETKDKAAKTEISVMYFNQLPAFEALVESTYEDIDLVVEQNSSATLDSESERRLKNDHGSDLIMTTLPGGAVRGYTYDISAESFVLDYSSAMTKQLLIDGQTHYLPLPGQYYGYVVNETLIKELGFDIPECNQDIFDILEAAQQQGLGVGVNGDCIGFYNIGENYLANLVFGNYVPDFLAMPEGIIWLSDLAQGEAKFSGTAEPAMDFMMYCVEKGYFDSTAVLSSNSVTISNKNATHVEERMADRTMVMAYGDTELYKNLTEESSGDKFTMIPFLSDQGNPGWVISIGNGYLAVNKNLAQSGSEDKLDAALRVLKLLSTEDGQKAWMQDANAVFSYLQDGETLSQDIPEGIRDTVNNGYVYNSTLPNNVAQYFGRQMNMVISGKTTVEEAMKAVDNYGRNGFTSGEQADVIVGTMAADLIYENYNTRTEETALGNLIADAVRAYSGADIALVNGGSIRSSLYEGDVWEADLAAVCPYGNKIITVKLSGETLKAVLANGISQTNRGESIPGGRFLQVSGVCYTYRPMKDENDTGELLDVTLPDGMPVEDDDEFIVAVTDYMAGSSTYAEGNGDGFVMLNVYDDNEEKKVTLVSETGVTYREALKAYFSGFEGEVISSGLESRITIAKEQ